MDINDTRLLRRALLKTMLGAVIGVSAVVFSCGKPRDFRVSNVNGFEPTWWSWILDHLYPSEEFGVAYFEQFPQDRNLATLFTKIDASINPALKRNRPVVDLQQTVQTAIIETVQKEYHDGEYVLIRGWLLSLTEARLYAAVTLSRTSQGNLIG